MEAQVRRSRSGKRADPRGRFFPRRFVGGCRGPGNRCGALAAEPTQVLLSERMEKSFERTFRGAVMQGSFSDA
jgi:hypothetical protein